MLANGVEVKTVVLDNIVIIAREYMKEMQALTESAVASLTQSKRNKGISLSESEPIVSMRKKQQKGT